MDSQEALQLTIDCFSSFVKADEASKRVRPYVRLCEALIHEGMEPTIKFLRKKEDTSALANVLEWFINEFDEVSEEYSKDEEVNISFAKTRANTLVGQLVAFINEKTPPTSDFPVNQNGKSLIVELQELKAGMDKK